MPAVSGLEGEGAVGRRGAGVELPRLGDRPAGELAAADAGGEAEVVLDPARRSGLAAERGALDDQRVESLGGAVDGGGEAGGAAADDHEVVVVDGRRGGDAEALGELEHGRALEHRAVLQQRDRQARLVDAGHRQQLARLAVALDVEPARRHAVAREEVAQLVRVAAEAVPDEPHAARLDRGAGLPGRQEVLDDREQLLLRRVPRLQQVVVERDLVDRLDRRLGVGVGGEQHALGLGHDLARLDQVVRS